jgi:cholesterol transport system auxiliary component
MMAMRAFPLIIALAAVLGLGGCASAPVPEVSYYRMPEPQAPAPRSEPAFQMPVVVDTLLADGLHGEQSILYATKPGGSVRSYHYQRWNDPPVRVLQRRLIRILRDANVSPIVADRLPTSVSAVRVSGVVDRFERVKRADGWYAEVRIEFRADVGDEPLPAVLKSYEAAVPAGGESIEATVRAFAAAVDQVLGAFAADLAQVEP